MKLPFFRLVYQHEETGRFCFKYIYLGDSFPILARYSLIAVDQQLQGATDEMGDPLFENDILLVPWGLTGDYTANEHYDTVVPLLKDLYPGNVGVSGGDGLQFKDCLKIGNEYEDRHRLDYEEALEKLSKEKK